LAQLGPSDMRVAIGYALSFPERVNLPVERLDFAKLSRLDFEAPDETRFPALRLARQAMQEGGLSGAVLNAAKEVALEAFIQGRIPFLKMALIVASVLEQTDAPEAASLDAVFAADAEARRLANELVSADK
jgi:1-deoxy-D-xylulose-5-phosphate reductoisomerase